MYKKYKLALIIMIVFMVITSKILLSKNEYKKYLIDIDLNSISEKIENKESFVLFIGKEDCPACDEIYPKIEKDILEKKEIMYYYEINDANRDKSLAVLLDIFPELKFVPYISFVKDGKEIKNILLGGESDNLTELWESFKIIKDDL